MAVDLTGEDIRRDERMILLGHDIDIKRSFATFGEFKNFL